MNAIVEKEEGAALIVVEPTTALQVFSTPNAIEPFLQQIAKAVEDFKGDASTAKGRAEIRSMAYRVTRSKTYLDSLGKELADEAKAIPKRIDESRRRSREFLEKLAEEVRRPLNEWEAEVARIEAEKKAAEEAERLAERVALDHEMALLMDADFNRKRDEEKARREAEIVERERRAAAEAEARAREEAERKVIEARLAEERAQRARVEAEERAARAEREAKERAAREAAAAVERERQRVEAEQRAAAAEQARRDADIKHRKAINREALAALMEVGVTEEQGKAVVLAIIAGKVPHVKITY